MEYIRELLNNREQAIAIWLVIISLWALTYKPFRKIPALFLNTLFSKSIILPITLMGIYIGAMVISFWKLGFWNLSNLKDTIIWVLGSAFVMFINVNNVKDNGYFKKIISDNLRFILIVEFIVNVYTFNFWVEFFLIPIIVVLSLMLVLAERDQKFSILKNLIYNVLALIGLYLIVYSFYSAFIGFPNLATNSRIVEFLLPPVFTILFLPFMYIIALYAKYEQIFMRLSIFKNEKKLINYAKWRIFMKFGLKLNALNSWASRVGALRFLHKQDIEDLLKK